MLPFVSRLCSGFLQQLQRSLAPRISDPNVLGQHRSLHNHRQPSHCQDPSASQVSVCFPDIVLEPPKQEGAMFLETKCPLDTAYKSRRLMLGYKNVSQSRHTTISSNFVAVESVLSSYLSMFSRVVPVCTASDLNGTSSQ